MKRFLPVGDPCFKTASGVGDLPVSPDTSQLGVALCILQPGVSSHERVGNVVSWIKAEVSLFVYPSNTNPLESRLDLGRLWFVYDRNPGASPSPFYADIVREVTENGVEFSNSLSLSNVSEDARYLILKEKCFVLPPLGPLGINPSKTSGCYASEENFVHRFAVDLRGLESVFCVVGGVPDVTTGTFYLFPVADELAATGSECAWRIRYSVRFYYSDK